MFEAIQRLSVLTPSLLQSIHSRSATRSSSFVGGRHFLKLSIIYVVGHCTKSNCSFSEYIGRFIVSGGGRAHETSLSSYILDCLPPVAYPTVQLSRVKVLSWIDTSVHVSCSIDQSIEHPVNLAGSRSPFRKEPGISAKFSANRQTGSKNPNKIPGRPVGDT